MTKLALTEKQQRALLLLEAALQQCEEAGLYLWDNDGVISAVNGQHVDAIFPVLSDGDLDVLDLDEVAKIFTDCWYGSNADDTLFVKWKKK